MSNWRLGLSLAAGVSLLAGSCGETEIHWVHEVCPTSDSPRGGSLAKGMMVRADTALWSRAQERFGIEALPEATAPGDMVLRLWHSARLDVVQTGLELRREQGQWSAWRYDAMPEGETNDPSCETVLYGLTARLCVRAQPLPENWARTWEGLRWVGLTEFEGDARLDGTRTRDALGGWWFVELVEGQRTHAYAYTDPQAETCRQPEAFARGLRLLGRELGWGLVAG